MSVVDIAVPLARTSEGMKAGPIGLAVILILCIACYFLFKSMSKHLRTVRETFPGDEAKSEGVHESAAVTTEPNSTGSPPAAPTTVPTPAVTDARPPADPPSSAPTDQS